MSTVHAHDTHAHDTEHVRLGLLQTISDDVHGLLDYLRDDRLTFDLDAINRLNWPAGAFADLELGRLYRGVAIFNLDAANDINVGFGAGEGTAVKRLFTISGRGYLVLPILASHISVGGAGTGTAVVVGFVHAPAIGGGKF